MSNRNTFRATHYLPQMAVATTLVVVLPVVLVWLLLVEGVISSPWVSIGLALALSLGASFAGSAYWKRRSGPGDVLFSEILLWGWLHRLRSERRLASAVGSLGLTGAEGSSSASVERRAETLKQMAVALDAQDPYTDGHSRRVALHAAMIARRMGMSGEEVAKIQLAAAVHDVGKLWTPPDLLNKPSALTPTEFEVVKRHAADGAEIVSALEDPELAAMVRHHHECFDGTGYPDALVGEGIPAGARVIAVADTFDALTSERPYRAAVPHKRALDIIQAGSGSQLDPVAVRAFLKCYSGKRAILFWTLLATSPQHALAMLGGRNTTTPLTPLGSATTVATPALLAIVVAAGVGTANRTSDPARFAGRSNPAAIAPASQPSAPHQTGPARDQSHTSSTSSHAKQATPGAAITPQTHSGGLENSPRRTGSTRNSSSVVSSSRHPRGGPPNRPPTTGPLQHPVTQPPPTKGTHPGGHPQPPAPPHRPTPPPPPSNPTGSGASTGNQGNNGQGGGNGGGNGQGGGPGQGGGNPGGGTGTPSSKQDCMGAGWQQFGFKNQGQCIDFVEHTLHPHP